MTPDRAVLEMARLDELTARAQEHWQARMKGKSPLTLTADDRKVLESAPPDLLSLLEVRLGAYSPVHPENDIRHDAARVALAELLRCIPQIGQAARNGFAAMGAE